MHDSPVGGVIRHRSRVGGRSSSAARSQTWRARHGSVGGPNEAAKLIPGTTLDPGPAYIQDAYESGGTILRMVKKKSLNTIKSFRLNFLLKCSKIVVP